MTFATDQADGDPIVEAELTVAFDIRGDRRRAETLSRRQEEWLPDTVVVDGPVWWARTGDSVQTNDTDSSRRVGGTDMVALLLPGDVLTGFRVEPTAESENVAGRTCLVALASRLDPDPSGGRPGSRVFDMIEGGDEFRLSVDLGTGVLLRVVKLVDGAVAERWEFAEITFDEPIDEQLFAPLIPIAIPRLPQSDGSGPLE